MHKSAPLGFTLFGTFWEIWEYRWGSHGWLTTQSCQEDEVEVSNCVPHMHKVICTVVEFFSLVFSKISDSDSLECPECSFWETLESVYTTMTWLDQIATVWLLDHKVVLKNRV